MTKIAKTEDGYLAAVGDGDAIRAQMAGVLESLNGQEITPFDFDRVTVPAAGGGYFNVPSLTNPDGDQEKDVTGVIVHSQMTRSYWKQGLGEGGDGGDMPDCASQDNVTGSGDPGGECAPCPLAQWGSDGRGRGQACKLMQTLFLLRNVGGQFGLPLVVQVPPSSLKYMKKYLMAVAGTLKPLFSVETTIGLNQSKNRDGIKYSEMRPSMARELSPEERDRIVQYRQLLLESVA